MSHLDPQTLDAYLDGQLGEPERAAVTAHLATCSACQHELAELTALFHELEMLPAAPLPADLVGPVLAQITPQPRRRAGWLLLGVQLLLILLLSTWLATWLAGWATQATSLLDLPGWAALLANLPALAQQEAWALFGWMVLGWRELAAQANALQVVPGSVPWGLILGAAVVGWLIGNRLLLAGALKRQQEA